MGAEEVSILKGEDISSLEDHKEPRLIFTKEWNAICFFLHKSIKNTFQRKKLTELIKLHGGEVLQDDQWVDTVIVDDLNVNRRILQLAYSCHSQPSKRKVFVEPMSFIPKCIRTGRVVHSFLLRQGMGGHTGSRMRNEFTADDEEHLCRYIAMRIPDKEAGGRLGMVIYIEMQAMAELDPEEYMWVNRHTPHSWRDHYKMNAESLDPKIERCKGTLKSTRIQLYYRDRRYGAKRRKFEAGQSTLVASDKETEGSSPQCLLSREENTLLRVESHDQPSTKSHLNNISPNNSRRRRRNSLFSDDDDSEYDDISARPCNQEKATFNSQQHPSQMTLVEHQPLVPNNFHSELEFRNASPQASYPVPKEATTLNTVNHIKSSRTIKLRTRNEHSYRDVILTPSPKQRIKLPYRRLWGSTYQNITGQTKMAVPRRNYSLESELYEDVDRIPIGPVASIALGKRKQRVPSILYPDFEMGMPYINSDDKQTEDALLQNDVSQHPTSRIRLAPDEVLNNLTPSCYPDDLRDDS